MPEFATYFHLETFATTKSVVDVEFVGYSYPHYKKVYETLAEKVDKQYPNLPLRQTSLGDFERVHTKPYLQALEQLSKDEPVENMPRLSIECSGMAYCLPGYCYGLGGLFEAIDRMKSGTLQRAYCFSGMAGHHAYADWGHGYCILNASAVATRYAQEKGFNNIVILDWDVHHGDGTQSIFEYDPSVYCISIHNALELYMMGQRIHRSGLTDAGEAVGHCNIPLLYTNFDDGIWERLNYTGRFYRAHEAHDALKTALENVPFTPDLLMIFSGYDSHRDDCGENVTGWAEDDFIILTQMALDFIHMWGCPVLSVHGGGYNLPVTVSSAMAHIKTLAEYNP